MDLRTFGDSPASIKLVELLHESNDTNIKKISRNISRSLTSYNLILNELKKIDTRVSIGLAKRIYHEYTKKIDGYPLPFKTYVHNVISYYYKRWLDERKATIPNKLRIKK